MSLMAESNESSMMPSLIEFFSYDYNFEILQEFINSKHTRSNKLSIGLLDWFNVNYAPEYNVEYVIKKGNTEKVILVWQSYNAALAGYGKALFDPFARGKSKGETITLKNANNSVVTTLRQLNYFRWAIKNGIIDFVKNHVIEIYEDMCKRSNRGRKSDGKKQKLSVSASKTLGRHDIKMTINFG